MSFDLKDTMTLSPIYRSIRSKQAIIPTYGGYTPCQKLYSWLAISTMGWCAIFHNPLYWAQIYLYQTHRRASEGTWRSPFGRAARTCKQSHNHARYIASYSQYDAHLTSARHYVGQWGKPKRSKSTWRWASMATHTLPFLSLVIGSNKLH